MAGVEGPVGWLSHHPGALREKRASTSSLWHAECHHFFPGRVRLLCHQAIPATSCSYIASAWELGTFILWINCAHCLWYQNVFPSCKTLIPFSFSWPLLKSERNNSGRSFQCGAQQETDMHVCCMPHFFGLILQAFPKMAAR